MKKLDTYAGPGEIKRREVVLDPRSSFLKGGGGGGDTCLERKPLKSSEDG